MTDHLWLFFIFTCCKPEPENFSFLEHVDFLPVLVCHGTMISGGTRRLLTPIDLNKTLFCVPFIKLVSIISPFFQV